ncbi:MAG: efflux RND transporter permease subunit [Sumerlaeia bacterium]
MSKPKRLRLKEHTGEHLGPIAWMAQNHVTSNLLMIFLIVGGIFAASSMKQEVFPEFTRDAVTVTVSYPGASPEEIERGVVMPIEEAVRGLENVIELWSRSGEGSARVNIDYEPSADPQKVYQDIQQAIDRIRTFPEEAEEPEITIATRRRDVMDIQVYGDVPYWSLRNIAGDIRDQLVLADGVTQVELQGARDYEVHIEVSREKLRTYGLTIQEVANRVAENSVEVPGGSVKTEGGELLVRFDERRDFASEFGEVPIITTPEGSKILLRDIGVVREGFEDVDEFATFNGKPAIGIEVFRIGDETPIGVSRAVRAALDEIQQDLPVGIGIAINDDDSEVFKQRRDLLLRNMGIGLILVLTFLGLFLEPRLAFWVTLGIPISFLGSFLVLNQLGVSINMISMFAFIIALGIVVDDAIVVGENVHEYRSQGLGQLEAAVRGAKDVAMPVTFSIITNCVAFLPLALVPGNVGKIWFVIPVVVNTVFILSLIESLFVLPNHLSHLAPKPKNKILLGIRAVQHVFAVGLQKAIDNLFAPVLRACIHGRYLVVATSLAILMISVAYAMSGRMGLTFLPRVEADSAVVTATLPVGSSLERTEEIRGILEAAAARVVEKHGGENLSTGVYTSIEGETVESELYLTSPEERPIPTREVARLWREELGELPGVDTLLFESDRGGPGGGASLTVDLNHPDIPTLKMAGVRLAEILTEFPQVRDIDDGTAQGKPQYNFQLRPEGRSLGLTAEEVGRQIRNAFEGAQAMRQLRGRDEVIVRVMLPEEQRSREFDIEQLMIRTPSGSDVPLRLIADVERGRAYTAIERNDARRTVEVTANIFPEDETNLVQEALVNDILPQLTQDIPGLVWSFGGRQQDRAESMAALGNTFLLALLAIYALLAIPFKSYTQPLLVVIAIPFGTVGAILGHYIMDYSLSVISMMGIIALSGVVINDALVMVVYANQLRDQGESAFDAIYAAGVRRFRPILLTTLTTFGGLAPMIFETSLQARFMVPMAISLGYGLLFATAIILILVPALYVIREDIIAFFKKTGEFMITPGEGAEKREAVAS